MKEEKKKIGFKELNLLLKAVAVFGMISLLWNIIVFIAAFIIGFNSVI